jgi:hypothetical protein
LPKTFTRNSVLKSTKGPINYVRVRYLYENLRRNIASIKRTAVLEIKITVGPVPKGTNQANKRIETHDKKLNIKSNFIQSEAVVT